MLYQKSQKWLTVKQNITLQKTHEEKALVSIIYQAKSIHTITSNTQKVSLVVDFMPTCTLCMNKTKTQTYEKLHGKHFETVQMIN